MVSGFGLKGLTDGLIRGAQAGRQIDNWEWQDNRRDREQERWQQQDELAELNQTLKKNQLEQLKDEQFRQEYKRHIRFLRYAADQAMDPETGQEWQERVKRDKQLQKDLAESWQVVADPIVNRGGPEGARKSFAGWVPLDDGRVAPRVKVERPDGETYTAPMTANRDDDPEDEVLAWSPGEIPGMLAQGERLAEMVDTYAVRAGLEYPLERQAAEREAERERAATESERAFELAKIRLKDRLDDGTATEREIADLVSRGVPRDWATDVARGNVSTEIDQFGNTIAVNRATGQVRTLREAGAPAGDAEVREVRETGGASAGGGNIFDAVEDGTGPRSNIQSVIGGVIGPFVEGAMFPETEQARSAIRNFNQTAKQALVNSDRFPVYEQKIVAELLPSPGTFWQDPDAVRDRLVQLRDFLKRKQTLIEESVRSGRVTEKKRGELANQSATIERVLGLMGSPDSQPDGRQQAPGGGGNGAGSPIGQMNLRDLQALDPSQLSNEELQEASRRYRQLQGGQ